MNLRKRVERLEANMPPRGEEVRYSWNAILCMVDGKPYQSSDNGKGQTVREWKDCFAQLNEKIEKEGKEA